jgi:hypothetical protein
MVMKIFAISGDGIGAGKTTLAKMIAEPVWSLAGQLRRDLSLQLPDYNWENRSQDYKDKTRVHERQGKTVRQVMVEYGQSKSSIDPHYWVQSLCDRIGGANAPLQPPIIAIDDVRKVAEIEHIRGRFPGQVIHLHVEWDGAIYEPEFDNAGLKAVADYIIRRNK